MNAVTRLLAVLTTLSCGAPLGKPRPPETVAATTTAAADTLAPKAPEHISDAAAPPWGRPLYCSGAALTGLLFDAAICGETLAACTTNLEEGRDVLRTFFASTPEYSPCAPMERDRLERVHCYTRSRGLVCSGVEEFCNELSADPSESSCTTFRMP